MFSKAFTFAGLAAVANAHMLMTKPVPYNQATLNNSPLDAGGSDFPCKMPADGQFKGASNVYAQGSKQKLEFQGSAVHGGGSCQLSVTTDMAPNKNSVWKVIKSIEGGCPAKNTPGNLPGGPESPDPFTYDFTVPEELAAGNYTLAWTWFNRIGNREMYMNCAPMTVTGSGGSEDFMSGLPNMFIANIGIGECKTKEGIDVQFPDAGKDVDRFGSPADLKQPDGCGSSPGGSSSGGSSSGGSPASSAAPVSSTPAAAHSEPAKPSGGVFVPLSESGSGPSPPAATPTPSGDTGAPAPSPGTGNPYSGPCTSEGQWYCIDGKTSQRCASGLWTAVRPVAPGTACTPGLSNNFLVTATGEKRNLRRGMRFS